MITKHISQGLLQESGFYNNTEFWETYSSLTSGTATDHMVDVLSTLGYTGSPREMLNKWLDDQRTGNYSFGDEARRLMDAKLFENATFYKDFSNTDTQNTGFSGGSAVGTFTASRGASTPATYIDSDGVVQLNTTSNAPRFTGGYYGASGFVTQPGLMIEGASTNLLLDTAGVRNGSGVWTNWTVTDDATGAPTVTNPAITDLTSISSAASQRIQMTLGGGDTNKIILFNSPNTAVGSIVQNDIVTLSYWAKKGSANTATNFKSRIVIRDAAGVKGEEPVGSNITLSTEWRRYTQTLTVTDADASRANVKIGANSGGLDDPDVVDWEIWGVQVEVLPFASSFIPTTTAALTRNAEGLEYALTGNRTAAQESSVVKFAADWSDGLSTDHYLSYTDVKVRRHFYRGGAVTQLTCDPNNTDDSGVISRGGTSVVANTSYVFGYSCDNDANPSDTAVVYVDGVEGPTKSQTNWTANTWSGNFNIGSKPDNTTQLYGTIQVVAFYSDVKTAAEHAILDGLIGE